MFIEFLSKSKIATAALLIVIGVLGRFFLIHHVGIPNFEIITALTLVSAVFLGRIWALVVPLSIIAITDVFIGNNSVMFFTWSAFAMIGALGILFRKYQIPNTKYQILGLTGMGIVASVFFFLYTNFGWWLISGMYPHTVDGLIKCYIMGLPFFKNNLIGNLIFVPAFSMAAMVIVGLKAKMKNKINPVGFKKVLSD